MIQKYGFGKNSSLYKLSDNVCRYSNKCITIMKELIIKYQKEIDFINRNLKEALFIGKNNKLIYETELRIYKEFIKNLKEIKK